MFGKLKKIIFKFISSVKCKCSCSNCVIRKEENTTTINIEYNDEKQNRVIKIKDIEML